MSYDKVKYNAEYNKKNYTVLRFQVKKGEENKIKEHLKNKGYKSLNSYINDLIRKDMEGGGTAGQESS